MRTCSSHNSSTTRTATATTKKTKRLLKKEVTFTSRRLKKNWFGHNGSVRREGGGSSGIAHSVLSREASAGPVYMLRQWLRRETSVWLTRTLSHCFLVLQPPPGSVAPDKLDPCLQPCICVAAFFERTFWLTKRCFSLAGGWSWHAHLPRISPGASVHPSCVSQETNVLNTVHLLMWRLSQPYAYTPRQFRPQTLAIQIHTL